jgi:hypothetical protein
VTDKLPIQRKSRAASPRSRRVQLGMCKPLPNEGLATRACRVGTGDLQSVPGTWQSCTGGPAELVSEPAERPGDLQSCTGSLQSCTGALQSCTGSLQELYREPGRAVPATYRLYRGPAGCTGDRRMYRRPAGMYRRPCRVPGLAELYRRVTGICLLIFWAFHLLQQPYGGVRRASRRCQAAARELTTS